MHQEHTFNLIKDTLKLDIELCPHDAASAGRRRPQIRVSDATPCVHRRLSHFEDRKAHSVNEQKDTITFCFNLNVGIRQTSSIVQTPIIPESPAPALTHPPAKHVPTAKSYTFEFHLVLFFTLHDTMVSNIPLYDQSPIDLNTFP